MEFTAGLHDPNVRNARLQTVRGDQGAQIETLLEMLVVRSRSQRQIRVEASVWPLRQSSQVFEVFCSAPKSPPSIPETLHRWAATSRRWISLSNGDAGMLTKGKNSESPQSKRRHL